MLNFTVCNLFKANESGKDLIAFGSCFQAHKIEVILYHNQKNYAITNTELRTLKFDFLYMSKFKASLNVRHAATFPMRKFKNLYLTHFHISTFKLGKIAK